jgi:uncharacterized repeat protein (TIGR01451 family)
LALLAARAGGLVVLAAMVVGLTASASAQVGPTALGIVKTSSRSLVRPEEVITYTIVMLNTGPGNASVTMTDVLPFGVLFIPHSLTPGATYAAGQVTWSGTLAAGVPQSISFRVLVYEPGTVGPLPIVNTACMDDGTGLICSSTTVLSFRWAVFLPIMFANAGR